MCGVAARRSEYEENRGSLVVRNIGTLVLAGDHSHPPDSDDHTLVNVTESPVDVVA